MEYEISTNEEYLLKDIQIVIDKYKNDDTMNQKIKSLLKNIPKMVEQMKIKDEKRKHYIEEMNNEQENFINNFLATYHYFYIPNEERFFYYNNKHYIVENEDDISHKILTSINGQLINWKFKTSVSILRKIKEKHIFKSIPDSYTIQYVLNKLYPVIFKTKEETKYFLTVIGDNILKKNKDLHYFVNTHMKEFINEINKYACHYFGNIDCLGTIKTKYYEHELNNCRIINTQKSIQNKENWISFLKNNIIDLIVVSCHYSGRYLSADLYLDTIQQSTILERIIYLKNYNHDSIVNNFTKEYIEQYSNSNTSINYSISWKNMQFLWKRFLNKYQLPNIVYIQQLKVHLCNQYIYDESKDEFTNVISKYLPKISNFLDFFNANFFEGNEMFEINEIIMMYNDYIKDGKLSKDLGKIEEDEIYEVLSYFSSNYEIENEKQVFGLHCLKWNKKNDIDNAVRDYMMENFITNEENIIPYDCYEHYISTTQNQYKINKEYFINNIN
uniref:Uncharacterized protein n=1 Tax=viral metagenome TaxID=1070528 RepID=A0A6C0AW98_9ZZZZ|tara:strand:+ start:4637 stop:6136 length:1500 start_codon:yes stop_codon:yes gene_type:complete